MTGSMQTADLASIVGTASREYDNVSVGLKPAVSAMEVQAQGNHIARNETTYQEHKLFKLFYE